MKTNPLIYAVFFIVFIVIVLVLVFSGVLPGLKPSSPNPVTLKVWAPDDDNAVWRPLFEEFKKKFPYVTIEYRRIERSIYEDTIINSLAEDSGPDVFLLKNTWVTKHQDKIFPLPKEFFQYSTADFKRGFVDGAADILITRDGAIVGLPIYADTLALFYNKDIFNAEGIAALPQTWDDIVKYAALLTKRTPSGDIVRSGIALGTYANIEHAFEIVNALIYQYGGPLIDPRTGNSRFDAAGVAQSLGFFASFADPTKQHYSWNGRMQNSLDEFAEESSAMAFGFASDIERIRAKSPHINIGIAPFPQLSGTRSPSTYGIYYFPVASKASLHKAEAWQFILFVSSAEGSALYTRESGKPPSRRDLISSGAPKDELDVFYRQSLIARNWLIPDERATESVFREAVSSINSGSADSGRAASTLNQRLRLLLP